MAPDKITVTWMVSAKRKPGAYYIDFLQVRSHNSWFLRWSTFPDLRRSRSPSRPRRSRIKVDLWQIYLLHRNYSVLVKNTPLVKFIRNYIRDPSCVCSISSQLKISMAWFLDRFDLGCLCKPSVCLNIKEKIARSLERILSLFLSGKNNIFSGAPHLFS